MRALIILLILLLPHSVIARDDSVEASASPDLELSAYRIQPYDQITMMLKRADGTSEQIITRLPVLANGRITLGRFGDIKIEGMNIADLKTKYQEAEFLIFHQIKHVSVIGEVMRPGSYSPETIRTIYDAIASAGGFTRLSNKRDVKIVHQHTDGRREVYKINFPRDVFKAYDKGIGEDKYLVHEGDLISVPKSRLKQFHAFVTNLFNTIVQVSTVGVISGAVSAAIN